MSGDAVRRGPGFWIALGVGWIVIGYAVLGLVDAKQGIDGAVRVGVWVAAGHVAHDLLVAPAVVLIGFAIARVVRPRWRAPVHFGLAASAAVILVAYPALRGYGKSPGNPSIEPLDYTTAVVTVLAVIWLIALAWVVVRAARDSARPASSRPR